MRRGFQKKKNTPYLSPVKSKVVPTGTEFNTNVHITEPSVNLRPNSTYFRLRPDEVSYERMLAKPTAKDKAKKPKGEGGASASPGDSPSSSGASGGGSNSDL